MHRLLPDAPYESLAAYRAATGADAVAGARAMKPEALVALIAESGLRGRGGAGFPTGRKWDTIRRHACPTRFVVCNAAEGEPGTFKDRWLIRRNPYAVVEGMLIAAHAAGAAELVIGVKESFTREIARLRAAIAELGAAIEIVEGPEEYLFGEEKALLEVIDGGGPLPREPHNPPYEVGLRATPQSPNPALVNNVQTLAHVPSIVRHGAASFRATGTTDTPGTLLVTLCGDVARPGVYEVPAGVTLRTVLDREGGGGAIKAVLSGVSAAVIPAERFDTALDFESMKLAGSALGSAGFIAIGAHASIPRVAQSVARFLYVESCNQCSACKHGLRTSSRAIDELFDARTATADDIERALYGARSAPQANRCYLPVQGSVLITSLVARFRAEFDACVGRGDAAPAWSIPKLADFADGRFVLDEAQGRKKPDWTYEGARPATRRLHTPAPSPAGEVGVRLAPDVRHAFAKLGGDLDAQVNAALREWLRSRDR